MLRVTLPCVVLALLCRAQDLDRLRSEFQQPPDDARILMRWWWFGPSVDQTELERELRAMKEGGIGGVEIQPVYPLSLENNSPYLSDQFIAALRFAAAKARELGLRVDITLGSGWPFGGPHVSVSQAASRLRVVNAVPAANARSVAVPSLEAGENLIAAFVNEKLAPLPRGGRLALPEGAREVQFFIASRTGQQVKRAAVGAEGFVVDHYDREAVAHHLKAVGERLLEAFGPQPPFAVFSDSLEAYDSDWTPDFLDEFRKRRGYELTPWLRAWVSDIGSKTADIRHDWGQTLTELAEEQYLKPIRTWASAHRTRFRSQTYGIPPVLLSSNALVDLPEGEGWQWRGFSATRWAASASHIYGRPVTSSETWTWLHSPAFRATPLDMKAEADLHFLQGSNQIIGHGWPYSPPSAGEPGWRFYAAAALNDHNPWWPVMPEIAKYLQRVSFLLRQGDSANDVALYLPTDEAWAGFGPGKVSLNQAMPALLGPDLIPRILDAGFNFDFIDDRAIQTRGISYPVLVTPHVHRMPAESARRIEAFKTSGGIVVEAEQIAQLASLYKPDFPTGNPAIGFVHRRMSGADLYFVANTASRPARVTMRARAKRSCAELWNLNSGAVSRAPGEVDLAPYESTVLVFSDGPCSASELPTPRGAGDSIDASSYWKVTFPSGALRIPALRSWTDDEATRFFSGKAVYEREITIPQSFLAGRREVALNFGEGIQVEASARSGQGMSALLDSPVREAAILYINGRRAGAVWQPPYEVDVTRMLRAGANVIRIDTMNLAINTLAGQAPPDYKLLNLRYGARFQPQDMNNLQPVPAGLMGPIRVVAR